MKKEQKQAVRRNTPLALIMLVIVPLYGGYHNTFTLAAGAALACILLYMALRTDEIFLPAGPEAWCLYGIAVCMFAASPFAVSPGMAFTGGLRSLVWVLFFIAATAYSHLERRVVLDAAAYEGAALALFSILDFLYTRLSGGTDLNGRADGFFQYANTWGLYLLCCLLLLFLREERRQFDWPVMAVLLCGVFLTGSRGTFLLLFLLTLWYGLEQLVRRRNIRPLLAAAGGVGAACVLTAALSDGMVFQRLGAITLSSVTLNGRLLYALDGLRMILAHPLGVGRGGYLYMQAAEQTGVYTTQHIHNEYLQAALDGGVLCGVLTAILAAALLFRRGAAYRERAVCFAVCAHAFIDFDFQFTAIVFLLLLCGTGGRTYSLRLSRRIPAAVACGFLALLFTFFSIVYYLDFMQRPIAAYTLFPADLSLAEKRLISYPTTGEAEKLADRIVSETDLSMVAWDCKYAAAAQRQDWPAMVENKYRYLCLRRYDRQVYEEFTDVLEQACLEGASKELSKYRNTAGAVLKQLEEVKENTSPLACRVTEKPVVFVDEIQEQLQKTVRERMQ